MVGLATTEDLVMTVTVRVNNSADGLAAIADGDSQDQPINTGIFE